jgi:hypothetical protein
MSHALQFFEGFSVFRQTSFQKHFDSMVKQISGDVRALSVHRESRICVVLVTPAHEEMISHRTLFSGCRFFSKNSTQKLNSVTDGSHGLNPNPLLSRASPPEPPGSCS